MISAYCWKEELPCRCQPLQAKTERGIKFWCSGCGRYVLPDKNHAVYYTEGPHLLWIKGAGRDYKAEPILWAISEVEKERMSC